MATVTLTSRFDDLDHWPGNLFDARGGATVTSRTATAFNVTLGSGSDFAGYKIQITGTGFSYLSGVPVAGTMSQLKVLDGAGNTVITFGNLGTHALARDLSQFYSNMFGSPFDDAGPGPDGKMVWNHLLAGNDTINGTSGDDRRGFTGVDAGNDTYNMGAGRDEVQVGVGNDTYNGGADDDLLTLQNSTFNEGGTAIRGATINRQTGVLLDPWGGTDKFTGFERFQGSRFNDTFIGHNTERDFFEGFRGADVIDGGSNTYLNGEQTDDGRDTAAYGDDYWSGGQFGIVAKLQVSVLNGVSIRGTIRDGFGNTDTVIDVENVEGTRFNDVFIGSEVGNSFWGGQGKDSYVGGVNGDDEIQFDWGANGERPATGVIIDLTLSTGQIKNDGFGNVENATGIEDIVGTNLGDRIKLTTGSNHVEMLDGADTVTGAGGNDKFIFVEGGHLGDADRITDFAAGGAGRDVLVFEIENFANMTMALRFENDMSASTTNGSFLFDNATDRLFWDSNGSNAGGQRLVAYLNGVTALAAANFELWD